MANVTEQLALAIVALGAAHAAAVMVVEVSLGRRLQVPRAAIAAALLLGPDAGLVVRVAPALEANGAGSMDRLRESEGRSVDHWPPRFCW
jgi:hypothetical protein